MAQGFTFFLKASPDPSTTSEILVSGSGFRVQAFFEFRVQGFGFWA